MIQNEADTSSQNCPHDPAREIAQPYRRDRLPPDLHDLDRGLGTLPYARRDRRRGGHVHQPGLSALLANCLAAALSGNVRLLGRAQRG